MRWIVQSIAQRQHLTESAWLRCLIEHTLQSAGATTNSLSASAVPDPPEPIARGARLYVRLRPDDQLLLRERATARGMAAATYASVLLRAHLRNFAPLPKDELMSLRRSMAELRAIGRNLNQIARAANQGARVNGPSREDLLAVIGACEGLRVHTKALLQNNIQSWQVGHAEAHG
jgi:Bacterial mobilisation protein (MobC)